MRWNLDFYGERPDARQCEQFGNPMPCGVPDEARGQWYLDTPLHITGKYGKRRPQWWRSRYHERICGNGDIWRYRDAQRQRRKLMAARKRRTGWRPGR